MLSIWSSPKFCRLVHVNGLLNSVPNDSILDFSKVKAFAGDKINVAKKLKFPMGRIEDIMGKGEKMLVTSIFSFSQNVFKRLFLQGH